MESALRRRDTSLTAKSASTRARLIKTAEHLFSEHGIERVSLQNINAAAGQRNKNATHYHFGDKRGLLLAIFDKHQPAVIRRRDQLLDELDAIGDRTARGVVRAFLYPLAEKLFDGDGGRDYLRIAAELSASYAAVINELQMDILNIGSIERLADARARLTGDLPEPIAIQRIRFVISLILNGLADHSRVLDDGDNAAHADTELMVFNLEDCLVALCGAPMSGPCEHSLQNTAQVKRAATRTKRRRKASV